MQFSCIYPLFILFFMPVGTFLFGGCAIIFFRCILFIRLIVLRKKLRHFCKLIVRKLFRKTFQLAVGHFIVMDSHKRTLNFDKIPRLAQGNFYFIQSGLVGCGHRMVMITVGYGHERLRRAAYQRAVQFLHVGVVV